MLGFIKEIREGEVLFRDRLQFELKSEFSPEAAGEPGHYWQELYLFVPGALQIDSQVYTRRQFYRDQTTLIRYKTPSMRFEQLLDGSHGLSPLPRIAEALAAPETDKTKEQVTYEIKLLGNIIRSALREATSHTIEECEHANNATELEPTLEELGRLIERLYTLQDRYSELQARQVSGWNDPDLDQVFRNVEAFIHHQIDLFLTGVLDRLRSLPKELHSRLLSHLDHQLCTLIKKVNIYQEGSPSKPNEGPRAEDYDENFQYRRGLLKKYVLDALLLSTNRESVVGKYNQYIAMFAAGFAMFIYLLLFIWQGNIFVINSMPFVVITTFLYIVKDRLKDGLKALYQRRASRWLPDYNIDILADGTTVLGRMREFFSFLRPSQVPEEIDQIRNREFHHVLEEYHRPEVVLYSKKELFLNTQRPQFSAGRRQDINTIFRYNVARLLQKASDSYTPFLTLDMSTGRLVRKQLPKVYHLNVIVKDSQKSSDGTIISKFRKYRIILNKEGIKRVERVNRRF